MSAHGPLVDTFGRHVHNLRVSVTDRCNFRCVYCMPEEMQFMPRAELLSFEEITRFVRIVAAMGISKVRLTGGEPLVRRELPELVRQIADVDGIEDLALTTNGILLPQVAGALKAAGLHRLNVSLDSLDRDTFAELTRRDALDKVLAGIDAALTVGFVPLKVNAVAMRDTTEGELLEFARFARERPVVVRFIEFMPLDGDERWSLDQILTGDEIVERIGAAYPLDAVPGRGSQPAQRYRFRDGKGQIGIIATVTEPFCDNCDRIRLTADGKLRNCLFALDETDIRALLRGDADDDAIAAAVAASVWSKWRGHLINQTEFVRPGRNMSQIGG